MIQRRVDNVQARNQALQLAKSSQRLFAPLLEKVALCGFEGSFQAFLALVKSKGMAKSSLDIGPFSISLRKPVTSMGNRPFDEIDVAQVHDCFSLTELLSYEDLGFCPKGEARHQSAAGRFELSGELPVNTDGGLKAFGHPTGATGVRMIYENTLQLQGRAGPRQVKGAEIALSHNIGGHPTACGIAILGRA